MIHDGDSVRVVLVHDPKSLERGAFRGNVFFGNAGIMLRQGEDQNLPNRTLFFPYHSIRLVEKLT